MGYLQQGTAEDSQELGAHSLAVLHGEAMSVKYFAKGSKSSHFWELNSQHATQAAHATCSCPTLCPCMFSTQCPACQNESCSGCHCRRGPHLPYHCIMAKAALRLCFPNGPGMEAS